MEMKMKWIKVAPVSSFQQDLGSCVEINKQQIAVFNLNKMTDWYAVENQCPHKKQMVLSRGITGETKECKPKIACPLHKANFCLKSGKYLGDEENIGNITTFPVKKEDNWIYVGITS